MAAFGVFSKASLRTNDLFWLPSKILALSLQRMCAATFFCAMLSIKTVPPAPKIHFSQTNDVNFEVRTRNNRPRNTLFAGVFEFLRVIKGRNQKVLPQTFFFGLQGEQEAKHGGASALADLFIFRQSCAALATCFLFNSERPW